MLFFVLPKCITIFVHALTNFSLCGFDQVPITCLTNIGHGEQKTSMSTNDVHMLLHD